MKKNQDLIHLGEAIRLERLRRHLSQEELAEAPHNDFDKYLAETKDNWNRQLGKIEITGDNKDDKVNFYTALYQRRYPVFVGQTDLIIYLMYML